MINNNSVQLDQTVENFRKAFMDSKMAEQKKSDWRTMAKRSTTDSKKAIWPKGRTECI